MSWSWFGHECPCRLHWQSLGFVSWQGRSHHGTFCVYKKRKDNKREESCWVPQGKMLLMRTTQYSTVQYKYNTYIINLSIPFQKVRISICGWSWSRTGSGRDSASTSIGGSFRGSRYYGMTRSDSAGKGNHNKGKGELHDDDDDDLSLLKSGGWFFVRQTCGNQKRMAILEVFFCEFWKAASYRCHNPCKKELSSSCQVGFLPQSI